MSQCYRVDLIACQYIITNYPKMAQEFADCINVQTIKKI